MAKRNKYLTNKELLKEIHKSKNTFCSYLSEEYEDYDIILESLDRVNIRTIAQAKRNKADKIQKRNYEQAINEGKKVKQADFEVDWKKIDKKDLVFRIHTFEHIPEAPDRKKKPKSVADVHIKLPFPPFQHYIFNEDGELVCVGKSHWEGGLQNGYFSKEHGRMTDRLGMMFMKLCERYGTRANWRGYSYNEEMRGQALVQLSQVGLQFDESKSNNPFAWYTAIITNSFRRILNLEKKSQSIRDDILEMNDLTPSYTRQNAALDEMFKENEEKSK